MEEHTERVLNLVRLKPSDLMNRDVMFARMDLNVYFFLSSLIFFNNQNCKENIIDLEKHRWNYELDDEKFSKRAFAVLKNAGIKTFHDLVNFPSCELYKVKMCGPRTIAEFKAYIIRVVQVFSCVRIPGLPLITDFKIANEETFSLFMANLNEDLTEWKSK